MTVTEHKDASGMHERVTLDALAKEIVVAHGDVDSDALTVCTIVRDEIFLLPAFLDHYRSIGAEQFVVLDDGSVDGTHEYLAEQPDCAVLTSPRGFGDEVEVEYPDGNTARRRCGLLLRSAIARRFFSGRYAVTVDADEFLVLPDGIADLEELIQTLCDRSITSVAACMVEMYPASIDDLSGDASPRSLHDLVELYPYFDARPLVAFDPSGHPETIAPVPSSRLASQLQHVEASPLKRIRHRIRRAVGLDRKPAMLSAVKTPVARWDDTTWLVSSHRLNTPPAKPLLLALLHFRFTHDVFDRTERAITWQSHYKGSVKYHWYAGLWPHMRSGRIPFDSESTQQFSGAPQLASVGLLRWVD